MCARSLTDACQAVKVRLMGPLSDLRQGQHRPIPLRPGGKWKLHSLLFAAGFAFLVLSGCAAAKRLRTDYTGYEGAFAYTSNREMLLNLARLNQHDPTYFFKLGQIGTSYRMQAAISGTGMYVPGGTNAANVTGGGTPTLLYEKDPSFTFIPVNDDASAQLLLKPIPPELFYVLFQQGWRADQLFRLMVDRIEILAPNRKDWEVIRNTSAADNTLDYTRFLRISALVYELQKRGYLLLSGHKEFVLLAKGVAFTKPPEAKDLLDAQAKNLTYQEKDGQWELGQENVIPMFQLNVPSERKILEDMPELGKGGIGGLTALQTLLMVLKNGFAIQPAITSAESADNANGTVHLVMRSLIGVMTAAAQEQAGFDELMKSNPLIDQVHFKDLVPPIEQRPLLRLVWNSEDNVLPPLVQLTYEEKSFMVTDMGDPKTPEEFSWNRDLFRLISQLTAQVTVDISKFPLPTLLQLHTQ
jgi:hypothetical protein